MSLPKILVTAACGDLGTSAIRSLATEGYRLVGTDIKDLCPFAEYLECLELVPPAAAADYGERLLSISEKHDVAAVVPCSEAEIRVLSGMWDKFTDKTIQLVINKNNILDIFFDKLSTIQYLSSIAISVPKTILLSEYNSDFELPAIVKPRNSCGSHGIHQVDDLELLLYLQRRHGSQMILQELVGSPEEEYTTGIFSDGINTSSITFQRVLSSGGYSQEVKLVADPNIEALAAHIARSINLVGSINFQTRKVGDKYLPFEINPRISSTIMFRYLAGFKDLHWWIRHLLYGDTYNYTPLAEFSGVRCLYEKIF